MKIETITYKRVKNLGNYQTETLEATATLDDGDDPRQIGQDLKGFVLGQLFPPEPDPDNIPFETGDMPKISGDIPDSF